MEHFACRVAHPTIADTGEAQARPGSCAGMRFSGSRLCHGKTVAALEKIFHTLMENGVDVLATRMLPEQAAEVGPKFPQGCYNPVARTFRIPTPKGPRSDGHPGRVGRVTIVTAGTSDLPVAEEARETALWTGAQVNVILDVGVAGEWRRSGLCSAGRIPCRYPESEIKC